MTDQEKALEKLDREWEQCAKLGGSKGVVNKPVYHMLRGFCQSDAEFASLIAASDQTLRQCLEKVHDDARSGWSDYAVFSCAVAAYVPGAKIRVMMEIDLNGDIDAGVAFGKEAAATEKMYHDQAPREKKPKAEGKPAASAKPKISKPAKPAKATKSAKVLPPPSVSKAAPAEAGAKDGQAKIIRFNLLNTF